ncbi:hypothetical protein PGIN_84-3_01469 [Porphyromonas gingivalis]|nr:hypothetical protein PGIN_84-3_01469 [Porphyromonas gingivalis]
MMVLSLGYIEYVLFHFLTIILYDEAFKVFNLLERQNGFSIIEARVILILFFISFIANNLNISEA